MANLPPEIIQTILGKAGLYNLKLSKSLDTPYYHSIAIKNSEYKIKRFLNKACRHDKVDYIISFKDYIKTLSHSEKEYMFNICCRVGSMRIVMVFVSSIFKTGEVNYNSSFMHAAECGQLLVMKYLLTLEGVVPYCGNNYAIRMASDRGHLEVVKFLASLKGVDASDVCNQAILFAKMKGHKEVVKFLSTLPNVYD